MSLVLYVEVVDGDLLDLYKEKVSNRNIGDSGFDLHIRNDHDMKNLTPKALPTGVKCRLSRNNSPISYYVVPRSSIYKNKNKSSDKKTRAMVIQNSPGVVDATYTGEVHVITLPFEDLTVESGESFAQIVSPGLETFSVEFVDSVVGLFPEDSMEGARGEKGFGSSDIRK